MRMVIVLGLLLALAALFVRSYTLPPGPDRRGGTLVMLTWPTQRLCGSPRADCLGTAERDPVVPCLIGSLIRSRSAGFARWQLPFCPACLALLQRIALVGRNEAAARAKQAQIARFGWQAKQSGIIHGVASILRRVPISPQSVAEWPADQVGLRLYRSAGFVS